MLMSRKSIARGKYWTLNSGPRTHTVARRVYKIRGLIREANNPSTRVHDKGVLLGRFCFFCVKISECCASHFYECLHKIERPNTVIARLPHESTSDSFGSRPALHPTWGSDCWRTHRRHTRTVWTKEKDLKRKCLKQLPINTPPTPPPTSPLHPHTPPPSRFAPLAITRFFKSFSPISTRNHGPPLE